MGLQIFTSFSSFRFIIFCLNISLVLAEKHGLFWEKCEKFPNSNAVDIVGKCCGKLFYNRFSICIDYFSPVPRKLSFFRQKKHAIHTEKKAQNLHFFQVVLIKAGVLRLAFLRSAEDEAPVQAKLAGVA